MPDIPENVPIYVAPDFESDSDEDDESRQKPVGDSLSRNNIMEDKTAGSWQPYTKQIVDPAAKAASTPAKPTVTTGSVLASTSGLDPGQQAPKVISYKAQKLILLATALNMLAMGVYVGNRLIPRSPVTSSTAPSVDNLFGGQAKGAAAANIFSQITARANPCVVNIDVRMVPKAVPNANALDSYTNPSVDVMPYQASGLIVRSDGYILTSAHALKKYDNLEVTFLDNRQLPAKLVGKDDFTDLAVIKVDAENLPVLKFGDPKKLLPGDWVVAVGCPVGLDHTVTAGVVSSANRSLAEVNNNRVQLIQHDALLYIGSSGGPLMDIHGDVVGINAAVRGGTPGMSFSVPADVAAQVTEQLISKGAIARPYMGLVMEDIDPNMTRSLTLPSNSVAVRVVRVEAKSPGDAAGIVSGDIILKVKGVNVKSSREVRTLTRDDKPDQTLDLVILHDNKQVSVQLKLGDFARYRPNG